MKLEGVLIDFGDTLAHINEEGNRKYREAIFSVVNKSGYRGDFEELSLAFDDLIWNSMKGEIESLTEFWLQLLTNLRIEAKPIPLIEELEDVRSRYLGVVFKLYDGSLQVLAVLQKKFKLALVSNCAIGTSDIIENLGLTSYFDCISLSYKVGVRKPDKRIYLEALRCLRLKPEACIFVADEISDLEGACDLGLKTLLVRQGSFTIFDAKNPDFIPDFECDRILDISNLL